MRKIAMIFAVMLITMSAFNALSQNVILQPGQQIKLMNNAGNNWSWIGAPLENDGLPDLKFATARGFMHLDGYGKLGIGVFNARYSLDVKGDIGFQSNGSKIYFGVNDYLQFTDGTGDGFKFIYDGTERMRINNAGKVGIGTTNPRYSLDITGNLGFQSNGSKIYFGANDYLQFTDGTGDGFKFIYDGTERMRINNSGNVGIGTTNTNGYKLAVNGTIGAREIVVNTDVWADFVFAKDYKLMPLSEVESFITENNHLPDVPSEQEVKENGINVAEMNAKLLQKVEELTLYVIEQNKRIEELERQVKENK